MNLRELKEGIITKFRLLFGADYCFQFPKKTIVLIFRKSGSEYISYLFDKKNVSILGTPGEIINVVVLIYSIVKRVDYYYEYVSMVKPKLLITFTDNSLKFIEMEVPQGVTKVMIQNGFRSAFLDIFSVLPSNKNTKKMAVDYMCMFGESVSKEISRYISGNTVVVGSIRSNKRGIDNISKIEVLYISTFRKNYLAPEEEVIPSMTWGQYMQNATDFILWLARYCVNRKLTLTILGASQRDLKHEEDYYNGLLHGHVFEFIGRVPDRDTYGIIDSYESVVSIDSTLGYEALARGSKVAMFGGIRGKSYPLSTRRYGWPDKLRNEGLFWTDSIDCNEWERVMDYVVNTNTSIWNLECYKYIKNSIVYDKDNARLLSLLKGLSIPLAEKQMHE